MNISNLFNEERYKIYKQEVCNQDLFQSCLYDKQGNPYGSYGTMFSTTLFTHLALMRCIFDMKNLFPKNPSFLDLGSGTANVLIYAAHHGWKCKGIEASKECAELSKENIKNVEEKRYIKKDSIIIEHANFFPKDFKVEKYPGDEKEDDFRELLEKIKASNTKTDFSKFDLFYHFQVERRQNVLNLFSKYSKKNSYLIFIKTRDDSYELPDDVELIDEKAEISIYCKKTL